MDKMGWLSIRQQVARLAGKPAEAVPACACCAFAVTCTVRCSNPDVEKCGFRVMPDIVLAAAKIAALDQGHALKIALGGEKPSGK